MTYFSEKYQLGMITPFLSKKEMEYTTEGMIYSIPIDIVAYNGEDVITIELKSRNHKEGLAQAKRNQAFSDYCYLSVWADQVTEHLLNSIEDSSIGLIAVDEDVSIVIEAEHGDPNPYARETAREVAQNDI